MPQIKFTDRDQATNFLAECAKLAYGSGMLEGKSGGNGNIGMLGERVVKFRTHLSERSGEVTKNMSDSCAELRNNLLNSVRALLAKDDGDVDAAGNAFIEALKRDLDIGKFQDDDSNSQKAKSLLDRKVVAKVIDKIEKFTNDRIFDMALDGQKPASSQGVDTTFAAVSKRRANEILGDYDSKLKTLNQSLTANNWHAFSPEQKQTESLKVAKLLKDIMDVVLNRAFFDRFVGYLSAKYTDSRGWIRTREEDLRHMRDNLESCIGKWDQSSWNILKDEDIIGWLQDLERFVSDKDFGDVVLGFAKSLNDLRYTLQLLDFK